MQILYSKFLSNAIANLDKRRAPYIPMPKGRGFTAHLINDEYIKEKIKPSGYVIELDKSKDKPIFKFNNGTGSAGEAPLNIEWSEEKEGYEVYLMRKDGTRIYLIEADGRLKTLDFSKITGDSALSNEVNSTIDESEEEKESKRMAELLAKKNRGQNGK